MLEYEARNLPSYISFYYPDSTIQHPSSVC